MAAAIIPIVTTLLPVVTPLVVRLVDKVFPPKSGPSKSDAATEIVAAILAGLQATHGLPGGSVSTDQIKGSVQSTVDALNAQKQLQGINTAIDSTSVAVAGLADLLIHIGSAIKGNQ